MTDETKNEQPAEEVTQGQEPGDNDEQGNEPAGEQAGSEEQQQNPEGEQPEDGEDNGEELPPEVVAKELSKARKEAAKYRTKLREAEEKFKDAKTPEEIEAIVSELRTEREATEHALTVENVVLKHRLPDELAEVLSAASKGKTREELEKHAQALAKYAHAEDDDEPHLSGGLRPGSSDESFDAAAIARQVRRPRR